MKQTFHEFKLNQSFEFDRLIKNNAVMNHFNCKEIT